MFGNWRDVENIVERVKKAGLKAPAIIVVGDVVGLRETLQWYEDRPLLGKCIVVTRAREQASELVKTLSNLGADCLECPTIKIVPPQDEAPLLQAIQNLDDYDWIVFTSVNGVTYFFERLFGSGKDVRALNHLGTAAIGQATAKRLQDFGLSSDIVPQTYRAESVVVEVGGETGDKVEILSGLNPTDRVIVSGVDRLRTGDRVKAGT